MKAKEILAVLAILIAVCVSYPINAQNQTEKKKVYSLKEDKSSTFKEGKTKIAEIKFFGLDSDYEKYDLSSVTPLPESKARKALKQNRVLNKPNQAFNAKEIEKAIKTLNRWLVSKGYLKADIVVSGKLLSKDEMELIFSIERNTPVEITDIQFVGNKNISTEAFVANYKNCIGESWRVFGRDIYQHIVGKCSRELLYRNGFFQGKIGQVTPKFINENYILEIEVEEGVRFRVGEINIENPEAAAFSNKEIMEMLGMNSGKIINAIKIRDFLFEDLKNKYANKGYIEYDADLTPIFIKPLAEGLDGTVNLNINIDEGLQFIVGQIRFVGIDEQENKRLKEKFLLKEGEIYNRGKFRKGVNKINDLKEFYPLDCEQDVETAVSRRFSEVYLAIKIRDLTDDERPYYRELLKRRSCDIS